MQTLHQTNILVHILAGSAALFAGFAAAFSIGNLPRHTRFGKYFMWMMLVVVLTALFGVLIFKRNHFLLIITLLAGYSTFSGIRALRIKGNRPVMGDYLAALVVISSAVYYLYYILSSGLYWSAVIVYSTVGALFAVTVYDLLKSILPLVFLKKAVFYEHSYKMISALSGITSAFSGTVFPDHKPYSQFLPSVLGFTCIIVTFIFLSANRLPAKSNSITR
jgi:hypothetical protein